MFDLFRPAAQSRVADGVSFGVAGNMVPGKARERAVDTTSAMA
jgi:hypothetical protein